MGEELKPCPFCGGQACYEQGVNAYVSCGNCMISFSAYPANAEARERVTTRWNTRAPAAPLKAGDLEGREDDQQLIAFLRREAAHSGVWFAHKLTEAADRLTAFAAEQAPPPASDASGVEALREALTASMVAIDDWLHSYAPELCGEPYVTESASRIGQYGTLAYIAHVQEKNRAALAASPSHQQEGEV